MPIPRRKETRVADREVAAAAAGGAPARARPGRSRSARRTPTRSRHRLTRPFDQVIETLSARLTNLRNATAETDGREVNPLLDDLDVALENLKIADEELHVQNRELISARDESEHARERYRALFEFAPDAYLVTTSSGIILEANRTASHLLRVKAGQLIRKPLAVFVDPAEHLEFRTVLGHLPRKGRADDWRLHLRSKRTAASFPVEVNVAVGVIRTRHGETLGLQWLVRDLSDRLRVEKEGRQHLMELAHVARVSAAGQMMAGVAHELNQPLAAIVSFARGCGLRLSRNAVERPELMTALQRIADEALRAGEIIRRLRQFVAKDGEEREPTSISDLIRAVAVLLAGEANDAAVAIELELPPNPPPILADRIQIEQVIFNLGRNAIDSMRGVTERARRLRIRAARAGTHLEVTVIDTGVAPPEASIESMFDPFYTTKREGLGIGLTLSRSIIEAHGGKLWAVRNPVGGMTFSFVLPFGKEAP